MKFAKRTGLNYVRFIPSSDQLRLG